MKADGIDNDGGSGGGGPKRTRLTREARRAMILSAAADMFQKHGYAAASIDAIAMASGVSGPAIYRYFRRKSELLVALLDAAATEAVEAMDAAIARGGQAGIIDAMAGVMVDRALREGAVIGLLQATVMDMDEADRIQLGAVRAALVGRLAAMLVEARAGLSAEHARVHIEAALAIVGQLARRAPQPEELQRLRHILGAVLAA
jgi:AcrR family transcriptional regulator